MPNLYPVNILKTLAAGTRFAGVFILKKNTTKTAKTGSAFYALELGDKTGSFSCNIFSDNLAGNAVRDLPEGSIVRVAGSIDFYQGRFSPKPDSLEAVPADEIERNGLAELLVESSPENFESLCAELDEHISAIPHEGLRLVTRSAIDEIYNVFVNSSAAVSMHHAYRHGLLEHSCHLARAARALLPLYPQIDPSLAIAGTLLHDIGKTVEYTQGLSTRKTRAGILQGHVVLGYRIVRKHGLKNHLEPALQERLEHIILSHQGELEWGAATIASTPEAVFVSLVDNLDAKLGMVQNALRHAVPEGDEFSEFIAGLKTQLLLTPPHPQTNPTQE